MKTINEFYAVNENGQVWSFRNSIFLKNQKNTAGYSQVSFSFNGKVLNKRVHRLVAEAFIPNPNNYLEINHIDGNKENNSIGNLEWCTRSENIKHSFAIKLRPNICPANFKTNKRRSLKVINTSNNEIYDSVKIASEIFKINRGLLCQMLLNKVKNKTPLKYYNKINLM